MPDPRFFNFQGPVTLGELADIIGAELQHQESATFSINGVSSLNEADSENLSFLDNVRYKDQFKTTKAGACIVHYYIAELAPKGLHLLLSKSPYKAYALAAQFLYPEKKPESGEVRIRGGRRSSPAEFNRGPCFFLRCRDQAARRTQL